MNREIKFRIRLKDKSNNSVITIIANLFGSIESLLECPIDLDTYEILSCDRFTELLDKHNEDIYENDIIYVEYNRINQVQVKFNKGCYNIHNYNLTKCKLIGNIYKNPELLNS